VYCGARIRTIRPYGDILPCGMDLRRLDIRLPVRLRILHFACVRSSSPYPSGPLHDSQGTVVHMLSHSSPCDLTEYAQWSRTDSSRAAILPTSRSETLHLSATRICKVAGCRSFSKHITRPWRARRVLRRTMRPATARLRSMSCLCGVTASAEQNKSVVTSWNDGQEPCDTAEQPVGNK
jgi:hypothetical protein